jgi:hypothetical protein
MEGQQVIDLGADLADFGDEPKPQQQVQQVKHERHDELQSFADDLAHMPTSDHAAAKAKRRAKRGYKHNMKMVPLDDPHAHPRHVEPDWIDE